MIAVPKTISEECSALAFYGIEPSPKAAESFYHTIVKWFNEQGCPPDKMGVTGPGHSDKVISFRRGNAKLLKAGFEGITDIELISTIPGARIPGHDYYLTATYDGRDKSLKADVVARSSIATLSPTSMLPMARTLAQHLNPAYGIGYRREHRLGPELYASGICMGLGLTGADDEEAMNISRWGYVGIVKQVYREGLLRDVYPWNFLTQPQLNRQVGQVPLQEWIGEDPRRGNLAPLCDGITLWEVARGNLLDVRLALREAGVIFNWQTYPKR